MHRLATIHSLRYR